jgi:hypothetical protein
MENKLYYTYFTRGTKLIKEVIEEFIDLKKSGNKRIRRLANQIQTCGAKKSTVHFGVGQERESTCYAVLVLEGYYKRDEIQFSRFKITKLSESLGFLSSFKLIQMQ